MVKIDWEWINETVARRTGGRTIALPGTRGSLRVGIGEQDILFPITIVRVY